ncbi:TPA: Asp-tRNA(Asn)/Glu-tRNA(Gln) amidotransferase GatCAB subunit A [Candidatus Falkowbacteria bacterium]|nr:MAG: Glutamyl-tRNA(Gln) amidotransferase subunit A [Candidatus Falkowbacteria bacterium GW2011_GWF2_43_32]HBA36699.1 Asp-tRNA(Asn)/Glu-tRNA(Gln) amidotransferase GatCAB subunit A [Candidatus Falkowbacteria bacterium]
MKLNELTIQEARAKLDGGEISALDLTRACLARIKEADMEIHACLSVCEPEALAAAAAADIRIKAGETGNLLGIPYLCKDNIMTKGLKTTAASKILENYVAPYDATVIKKLKEAGAVLLGKTNLDEFAHGASTESSAYGLTKNPRDLSRVPGGSSGGSTAAVAADMCLFALGSDTGGSIRQPASFCGVVGLKPSYGRVSRSGLLSMTSSTDVIGPLTKTVEDAALVLEIIAGADERDATTATEAVEHYRQKMILSATDKPLSGLKIGWPKEYFLKELDKEVAARVRAGAEKLKAAGAQLMEVSLPYTKYGVPVYYLVTPSEISSNLARFDGIGWGLSKNEAKDLQEFYKSSRGAGFGAETKRRIMLGTYALSAGYYDAYYKKAQQVRTLIINDFQRVFEKVDLLLTPTSPHPAFKIGQQINDPLAMYLEDIFVTGASLAGLPAISVPAGTVAAEAGKSLPVGAQLIGPRLQEGLILKVAGILAATEERHAK